MTQCHSTLTPYEEKARHTVPAAGSAAPERERPESGRGGQGDLLLNQYLLIYFRTYQVIQIKMSSIMNDKTKYLLLMLTLELGGILLLSICFYFDQQWTS
ncbi:hypothetical protein, partial [Candidatus Cryptobacteroides sp.]|uniref:hypothetical protein n=1 Tax=Candidatus Cryptobacteroides sp. TaxID=2952915 RepID=UPI002A811373